MAASCQQAVSLQVLGGLPSSSIHHSLPLPRWMRVFATSAATSGATAAAATTSAATSASATTLAVGRQFRGTPALALPTTTAAEPARRSHQRRGGGWKRAPTCAAGSMDSAGSALKAVRVHYHRDDGVYDSWGLHVWGDVASPSSWESPQAPSGSDSFGIFWVVFPSREGGTVEFLIHKGDEKDCGGQVATAEAGAAWVLSQATVFSEQPDLGAIPRGNLQLARAVWLEKDVLAWPEALPDARYALHFSRGARLKIGAKGLEGADRHLPLMVDPKGLPAQVAAKFPHLSSHVALRFQPGASVDVAALVKCQLALGVTADSSGSLLDATSVQVTGVLDDAFFFRGPLGAQLLPDAVAISVWAPTAQKVRLLLFTTPSGGPPEATLDMEEEAGVWTVQGPASWRGKYYQFELAVLHPYTNQIETSVATDPYSRGLSANGERTLIVDLAGPGLAPPGWDALALEKPALDCFKDVSIYELHIRDFSATDETVEPAVRGGYLAFAQQGSAGVKHLQALSEAGLTHLHLLPSYDFASVDERKENWKSVAKDLRSCAPDSEEQQAAVVQIQNQDAFNWGYDPVHWGVPDGSYASDPDGSTRTLEFRTMVQSLNRMGLRVVLDVVYNHLYASGPHDRYSVLDKIVPGYYLRRNVDGMVESSACCNNTASEHAMVSRLIVEDLVHWAKSYKVDGFRFDLMGHMMLSTVLEARDALRALTVEADGVDGARLYLYGEGWDFGEVARNARGVNASQYNLAGTGIGSFNDRFRDMAMGGSPFGHPQQQGFLSGLLLAPNGHEQGSAPEQRASLLGQADCLKSGLAGGLCDFTFETADGSTRRAQDIPIYGSMALGYTDSPEELVNYVSAHDNETLYDNLALKLPQDTPLEERCRVNHLAVALVGLSQGVPFFHAGDELLRSKSLDRDSYNSGDWFNVLDFSRASSNWGVGLPPAEKNADKWSLLGRLLRDPALAPAPADIEGAFRNLLQVLRIRYSSPLFRLPTSASIQARLRFLDGGPSATPGVLALSIDDGPGQAEQLDPHYSLVVIVFNAAPTTATLALQPLVGRQLALHPVLRESADARVRATAFDPESGVVEVPARTAAVLVAPR